jgi:hypothetical protein
MSDEPIKKDFCRCPYCDAELTEPTPLCGTCMVVFVTCVNCGADVREGLDVCPTCGDKPS